MSDTEFTPPVTPARHMDMHEDILEVIQNSEKAHIEKQALDRAKKELECERSHADALISTFGKPGAMGGQLPPNTVSQQNHCSTSTNTISV